LFDCCFGSGLPRWESVGLRSGGWRLLAWRSNHSPSPAVPWGPITATDAKLESRSGNAGKSPVKEDQNLRFCRLRKSC